MTATNIHSVEALVTTETTRAEAAEASNATNITNENARATAAENTLATGVNTETTRATAAEAALSTTITTETNRALNEEAILAAGIAAANPTVGAIPAYVRDLGHFANTANTTTVAVTTSHSVDVGDTIVCRIISAGGTNQTVSGVSGGGLTWRLQGTHVGGFGGGPSVTVATAYAPSGLATSTTITATIGVASTNKAIQVEEWSRLQDLAADAVSPGADSSGTPTTSLSTGSCVGTQADNYEVFIASFATVQAQTDPQWSVDTGWRKRSVVPVTALTLLPADIVGQGTNSLAATTTGSADFSGFIVALKGTAVTPSISSSNFLPGPAGAVVRTRNNQASWIASPRKYVEDYGAVDDIQVCNAVVATASSAAVTAASAPFNASDVGKICVMEGAGTAGAPLCGTIIAYNSHGSVNISPTPATTVTSNLWWGSDNTAAFELAISKLPQPSGASVGSSGGTVVCEGHTYGFSPAGSNAILIGNGAVRHSVRLVGGGGTSNIEGGAYGTNLVAMKPSIVVIHDDGATQTPSLVGAQIEDLNIMDVAGGCTGVRSHRTNRMHLRSVTVRGRIARKDTIGFQADADGYDSSWHVLDEFRGIYLDKTVHVVEGYGTYWVSGEAEQCNYGYYGQKARHSVIGAVEIGYFGATAVYEQGGFLTIQNGAHFETANSTAASIGVHLDPGAFTPIDGCGMQICGATILAQAGAAQYGVVLEAGSTAGRIDFYTRSILTNNRVINNTGSSLAQWRGSVVDPTSGTLDTSTIP